MAGNDKRMSQEQKEEMKSRYILGETAYELAKEFGFDGSSVCEMLKREGVNIRQKKMTNEEINTAIHLYTDKKFSIQTIANKINRSVQCVHRELRKNGVLMRTTKETARIYDVNEHYFDIIDTEEKAYFLGLLYADGCNHEKTHVVSISLVEEDIAIIEKLRSVISPNKPISYPKRYKESHSQQVCISFTSVVLSQQLAKLGCFQAKSLTLKFPTEDQVPTYLLRHWLRGLWDGDGSFYIDKKNRCGANITGTNDICLGIQTLLFKEFGTKPTVFNRNNSEVRYITIGNNSLIVAFIKWLYVDSSIYTKRKYDKSTLITQMLTEKPLYKEWNNIND